MLSVTAKPRKSVSNPTPVSPCVQPVASKPRSVQPGTSASGISVYAVLSAGTTGVNTLVVIPLQTTLFCLLTGVGMSLVLLAFSSVGKRTIFITVWWTILFMGSEAISALFAAGGFNWLEFLNFAGQYHNAGSLLLGTDPRLDIVPVVSMLSTLLYAVLALLILRRFVRPVEVVS